MKSKLFTSLAAWIFRKAARGRLLPQATSAELRHALRSTVFAVEAQGEEYHTARRELCQRFGSRSASGYGVTVGAIADRTIHVHLRFESVDGMRVLLWEPTSTLVDYELIQAWMKMHLPHLEAHGEARRRHCDTCNIHLCLQHLADLTTPI